MHGVRWYDEFCCAQRESEPKFSAILNVLEEEAGGDVETSEEWPWDGRTIVSRCCKSLPVTARYPGLELSVTDVPRDREDLGRV